MTDPTSLPPAPAKPTADQPASCCAGNAELWSGRPSQLVNARHFVSATLLVAGGAMLIAVRHHLGFFERVGAGDAARWIPYAGAAFAGIGVLWAWSWWLRLAATRYRLVEGSLEVTRGMLAQRTDLLDLFRVRDLVEERSLLMRLCGLGTIRIISGDATTPDLALTAIRGSHRVLDLLRAEIARARGRNRVMLEERE